MPLARIVTNWTEESQPLQAELRARGFEVETASPDQSFAEPADLEITLEEMTPAQALARADEIADALDIPVFIAPGSISEGSRPITVIPIMPEPLPALSGARVKAEEEPQFDPVTFYEKEEAWVAPPVMDTVIDGEVPAQTTPDVSESAFEGALPEPVYAEQISEPAQESMPEEPVVLAPEVQEMLPELEAVMPDMEAWAREEGPVSDWPIWQAGAIDPLEFIKAMPVVEIPQPEPVQVVRKFRRNPFASERVFWKTAAWAAMVALSALVLGATVHRFSPIPARFANTAGQPAELKPAQSNTTAAAPVVKPTAILKRTAAHEPQVSGSGSGAGQAPSPKARVNIRHRNSGNDILAEDTVVRYGAKPPAPKVQAQMKPDGIKRYTDLK